jgi:hypothetical protein
LTAVLRQISAQLTELLPKLETDPSSQFHAVIMIHVCSPQIEMPQNLTNKSISHSFLKAIHQSCSDQIIPDDDLEIALNTVLNTMQSTQREEEQFKISLCFLDVITEFQGEQYFERFLSLLHNIAMTEKVENFAS